MSNNEKGTAVQEYHPFEARTKVQIHRTSIKSSINETLGLCHPCIDEMLQEQEEPPQRPPILSPEQIHTFITDGVLVVDHVLTSDEIETALSGLHDTLRNKYSVDTTDLCKTGHHLTRLSSTNGSGGVLDIYYEPWQIQLFATNTKLFHITTELWKHMYINDDSERGPDCESSSSSCDGIPDDQKFMWHPYGSFDYRKGYMYLDRIGYRLPTQVAYDIAEKLQQQQQSIDSCSNAPATSSKKRKLFPIQRSLTPHFDCCPSSMYKTGEDSIKWRPIQSFISLSDTLEANHGGFEAAKGFHHEFFAWSQKDATSNREEIHSPAPCIGEYAHLRPKEDNDIYKRIKHVPVSAGSAVFWDNRYVRELVRIVVLLV